MPTDRRLNVLVLGDDSTAEMQPLREAKSQLFADDDLRRSRDAAPALAESAEQVDCFPDLIVVCQNWPDEFSADDVRDLLESFPLARLVCGYGPWSESDGRTRATWPSGCRVPVAHAARRIAREADSLRSGRTVGLPPLTAARDEVFEFGYACPKSPPSSLDGWTVSVVSPDAALRRMLIAAATTARCRIVSETEPCGCRLVLWDADPWSPDQRRKLLDLRERSPAATIVAVAGLPCAGLTEELLVAGADRVVSKLASLEQLFSAATQPAEV